MADSRMGVLPTVTLLPEDRRLLDAICHQERRPAAYQVSWLIRDYAKRQGIGSFSENHEGTAGADNQSSAFA